ncbi:MAG: ABC transporter permease, partial [Acidimicrobiia bacterium]|nr:ABC transporter permease [Acidimicrobiia bacterium]
MTTTTVKPTKSRVTPAHAIKDMWIITKRNLRRFIRKPQLLLVATVQPVMFLLLFTYVFGGAIVIPGVPYIDFLLPGILVQTVMFGATNT